MSAQPLSGPTRRRSEPVTVTEEEKDEGREGRRRRYFIDIEGTDHEWPRSTITVPEIRQLGSLTGDQPIVEVNLKENTERELPDDETVTLEPGRGYARKVRYQRG
jgi:poly(3-hydroxybutyrate) depolymerase